MKLPKAGYYLLMIILLTSPFWIDKYKYEACIASPPLSKHFAQKVLLERVAFPPASLDQLAPAPNLVLETSFLRD